MSGPRAAQRSKKGKPEQASPAPRRQVPAWLPKITLAVTAICLIGIFCSPIADTDFWWHLKTGQYIVERHSLPLPDPFAYTSAVTQPSEASARQIQHFNLTHEWLAQTLLYVVYLVGGFSGIVLVRAALLAAFCGLAGFLAAHLSKNFWAGIAAAFAAASIAIEFRADRPALITFLFVAVFVTVLELRRAVWILPGLALLWANCHGGFFLGWVVLLAYAIAKDRRLWLVTASSIAVSGLNPNGFGVVSTLVQYRQSELQANLLEWHRPYLWGPPYAFDILLYAAVIVLVVSWRRVRLSHWLLFAAFAGAALTAFRNIPFIGFLAPILIGAYFPWRFRIPRAVPWAVPALVAAGLVIGLVQGSIFDLRVATWTIPESATDYMLSSHVTGHLFNTYEQGGYLIWKLWPQQQVFIDGRALSESLNREYRQVLYNFGAPIDQIAGPRAELLNKYGVQAVVMNTIEYASGAVYPFALALANEKTTDWQLVYEDAQAVVFLRNPPANIPVLPNKLGRILRHLDTECSTYIEHSPDTPLCARTLADYWMRNGAIDRARAMLLLYLSHATEKDPQAERLWQQLGGGQIPKR